MVALKSVQLKLIRLKYGGDSVGSNINIEIDVLGKILRVDERIKVGATVEINREIGKFETDHELFQADIVITVTEKDLIFKDVGSKKGNIKISTNVTKPQLFVYKVEVKEKRSILGIFSWSRTAVFEIELEAQVGDIEWHTSETKDGWLVTKDKKGKDVPLPEYLKVDPKYVKDGREYLIPLEGVNRGELLSVRLDDESPNLISGFFHEPVARAKYSISKKVFILNEKQYKAEDDADNPWRKGIYDIKIPDHPHRGGLNYPNAGKGTVWFGIGREGDRYLHPGRVSRGCISIIETARWMEIYSILIKARKEDFTNVGILDVMD